MSMIKYTTVALVTAALAAPAFADSGATTSYRLKKQGLVHFKDSAASDKNIAAKKDYSAEDLSNLAPASGGATIMEKKEAPSLSDSMKLPRKN